MIDQPRLVRPNSTSPAMPLPSSRSVAGSGITAGAKPDSV